MKRWLLLLVFAHLLWGCSSREKDAAGKTPAEAAALFDGAAGLETASQADQYGYREQFQRRIADGVREGRYERFDPKGARVEEAYYLRDTLNGPRILFYPGGDTLSVEMYHMGLFEGEFRAYYENGQLQLIGRYVRNETVGEWRRFYDTGELMEVVTMKDNAENGPFVEYFRNGKLKAEGSYLDGAYEHGLLKLYDERGELIRKMDCKQGACRTIWKASK